MSIKITLSGFAGSGKSTVGKILCKKLSCEFVSVGDFARKYAIEYGMTINEFQEECSNNPEHDDLVDEKFQQYCNEASNIVADYRLGFRFVKNAFHVLLKASDKMAEQRIKNAGREKENTDIESIKKRNMEMRQRFIDKYDVDFADEMNYDLVVDTDELTPEKVVEIIINHFRKWQQRNLQYA